MEVADEGVAVSKADRIRNAGIFLQWNGVYGDEGRIE